MLTIASVSHFVFSLSSAHINTYLDQYSYKGINISQSKGVKMGVYDCLILDYCGTANTGFSQKINFFSLEFGGG